MNCIQCSSDFQVIKAKRIAPGTWKAGGYPGPVMHWVRKTSDERMAIASSVPKAASTQPPRRLYVLGLENASDDMLAFFRQEIETNALGNPHALSLKSRIMSELQNAAIKQHDWTSKIPTSTSAS